MKIIGASVEKDYTHDLDTVRRLVSAPALIVNWHPWIEEISIHEEGGLLYRKSVLSDGETELVEKVWADEHEDAIHFQVVQGLWADNRYRSKISFESTGSGSRVSWQGRLMTDEPEDESEQMEAFYQQGLEGLEALLAEL